MRAQEYTVTNYLMWAVFFTIALLLLYNVFNTTVKSYTPLPIDAVLDLLESASYLREMGNEEPVCTNLYISQPIVISKELLKRYNLDDLTYECYTNCEIEGDEMRIWGGGRLCVEDGRLVWKG